MSSKEIRCNLCCSIEFKIIYKEGIFKLCKCKKCGLVYVNPIPPKKELFKYYNEKYYTPWQETQGRLRYKIWQRRMDRIERFKKKGRLLDVGCGLGMFLGEAKKRGWHVFGTEVSEYARDYIKKSYGIEIFYGEFKESSFRDNFFDVVTFWHVLEHMPDPLGNLVRAWQVLKPQGLIVIAVPNINNYIFRIAYLCTKFRRFKIFSLQKREIHLYHFSPYTLRKIIEKAGFRPLRFDVDKEKIGVAHHVLNTVASFLYKVSRINIGMAIEAFASKE